MAEARSDQEPSIEEILASIREIISDDDAAEKEAAAAIESVSAEPEPAPAPVDLDMGAGEKTRDAFDINADDDILDLAAFADDPKEERRDPLAGIDLSKTDMNLAFTDPEVAAPEPAPAPEPEPAPVAAAMTPPPATDIIDTESLLNQSAKAASVDALSRLAQNIAISRAGNGGTLEDIVREMIRPMLKDWLDRNLPPMIERMVERELERMVKAAMDR